MKKFYAHYLFNGYELLKDFCITVTNKGEIVSIEPFDKSTEQANTYFVNGIIAPGFINAHCHLELSFLKDKIKSGNGLAGFINQMRKVQRNDDDDTLDKISQADYEMYNEGIVACGDIVNTLLSLQAKHKSKLFYRNFIELYSLEEDLSFEWIQHKRQLLSVFEHSNFTYHAPYSVSYSLFNFIKKETIEHPTIISIHAFESRNDNELFRQLQTEAWKKRASTVMDFFLQMDRKHHILFVHNTFITEDYFQMLSNEFKQHSWVLCPSSNVFIEKTLPPLSIFLNDVDNVCLGTDSYASNTSLSILKEIKVLADAYPHVPLEIWLKMATINGAKALNIHKKYGTLEIGKTSGLIAILNVDFSSMRLTQESYIVRLL